VYALRLISQTDIE